MRIDVGDCPGICRAALSAVLAAGLLSGCPSTSPSSQSAPPVTPRRAPREKIAGAPKAKIKAIATFKGQGLALHLDGSRLYAATGRCLYVLNRNRASAAPSKLHCRPIRQRIVDIVSNSRYVIFSFGHLPATNQLPGGVGAINKASAAVTMIYQTGRGPGPLALDENHRDRVFVGLHHGGIASIRVSDTPGAATIEHNTLGIPIHSHLTRFLGAHVFLSSDVVQIKRPKGHIVESLHNQKWDGLLQADGSLYGWHHRSGRIGFELVRWKPYSTGRGKPWRGSLERVNVSPTLSSIPLMDAVWDGSRFFAIGLENDGTVVFQIDLATGRTSRLASLKDHPVAVVAAPSALYILTTQARPSAQFGVPRRTGSAPLASPTATLWRVPKSAPSPIP